MLIVCMITGDTSTGLWWQWHMTFTKCERITLEVQKFSWFCKCFMTVGQQRNNTTCVSFITLIVQSGVLANQTNMQKVNNKVRAWCTSWHFCNQVWQSPILKLFGFWYNWTMYFVAELLIRCCRWRHDVFRGLYNFKGFKVNSISKIHGIVLFHVESSVIKSLFITGVILWTIILDKSRPDMADDEAVHIGGRAQPRAGAADQMQLPIETFSRDLLVQ